MTPEQRAGHDVTVSAAECAECKRIWKQWQVAAVRFTDAGDLKDRSLLDDEHLQAQKDALAELAVKWHGSVEEAIKEMSDGISRVDELLARHRAQMEAKK